MSTVAPYPGISTLAFCPFWIISAHSVFVEENADSGTLGNLFSGLNGDPEGIGAVASDKLSLGSGSSESLGHSGSGVRPKWRKDLRCVIFEAHDYVWYCRPGS